jgi:hypothetical protein
MLRPHRLSVGNKNKPQYKVLCDVFEIVVVRVAQWLEDEADLEQDDARSLARKVAGKAKGELQMAISSTAPDVYMPKADAIELLYLESLKLADKLDQSGELELMMAEDARPSESDLEDAYHVATSINFQGSEKQIKWAKSIALDNCEAIAQSKMPAAKMPTAAKWWIDNRDNVLKGFLGL